MISYTQSDNVVTQYKRKLTIKIVTAILIAHVKPTEETLTHVRVLSTFVTFTSFILTRSFVYLWTVYLVILVNANTINKNRTIQQSILPSEQRGKH